MSTKVNGETCARLGQSAKRSATIRGQAGRGATVAGGRLPGVAEQKLGNFLPARFLWKIAGRSASRATLIPPYAPR